MKGRRLFLSNRLDLLALKVALARCVIGYAEIATRLASRPDAHVATNPYRVWIAEYAGTPYQEVAAKARAHLERLATPAREAELIVIFKEATRLEADFWEMGWRGSACRIVTDRVPSRKACETPLPALQGRNEQEVSASVAGRRCHCNADRCHA
jgi:hypothetical protein